MTNKKFTINGKAFVFAGWNVWTVLEAAAGVNGGRFNGGKQAGRQMITDQMNEGVDSGLTVVRMWGHTITPGHALQPSLGNYNESIFEALDWILVSEGGPPMWRDVQGHARRVCVVQRLRLSHK